AQLTGVLLCFSVIKQTASLGKNEKFFWGFVTAIFLLSACQAESLLNPANLQWSLLVSSAIFTAWCLYHYLEARAMKWMMGMALGVCLVGLTSASAFLILVPLTIILFRKRPTKKRFFLVLSLMVIVGMAVAVYVLQDLPLEIMPALLKNSLKIMVDFMAPPVERLGFMPATVLTGVLLVWALWKGLDIKLEGTREVFFFKLLLWFSLCLIVATGIVRAHSLHAFTFRFVNIGLLFSLALLAVLFLQTKSQARWAGGLLVSTFVYVILLTYINYREMSAFGYGRNHIRLNQVAYALDMREPAVVSALPGTIWEKADYDFVQAHKHWLQTQGLGIYSDPMYRQVGVSVASVAAARNMQSCTLDVVKMRRLLPDQAAYKLTGEAQSDEGEKLSRVVFADSEGMIRGFAIPILASRDLWQSLREGKHWSGFVNLEAARDTQKLQAYAYNDRTICEPQAIELPAFQPFVKKEKKRD